MDLASAGRPPVAAEAQMVLHIPRDALFIERVGKLPKDLARSLADDVGQHIEPPAMGHAHHDFVDSLPSGLFNRQGEQRDQALGSFQRKCLGPDEFFPHELLEDRGIDEPRENFQLLLAR
jgi:hypothetical protein